LGILNKKSQLLFLLLYFH